MAPDLLVNFLFIPRLIYFFAFFAYDGIIKGVSLTHFGIRKGTIARIYGVFYLLLCIFEILLLPLKAREILEVNPKDMLLALLFSESIPDLGFILFGVALFLLLVREGALYLATKTARKKSLKPGRIQMGRNFTNWMIGLPLLIGLQFLLGLPYAITVLVYAVFAYFSNIRHRICSGRSIRL